MQSKLAKMSSHISTSMIQFFSLLWGTVLFRPYVYVFFAFFLIFSIYQLGLKSSVKFLVVTWCVAWTAEYSSTNGYYFPFGEYFYIDTTRSRELWVANVPFWDSLSFVFLSYFSYTLAAAILTPASDRNQMLWSGLRNPFTPIFGGILMMLLDVVIDPVALQGEKWFLGKVYGYPINGFYFGVTLANFLGWFFVGFVTQFILQKLILKDCINLPKRKNRWFMQNFHRGIFGVYSGVFAFNLFMTFWIQDNKLGFASTCVAALTLFSLYLLLNRRTSHESAHLCSNSV